VGRLRSGSFLRLDRKFGAEGKPLAGNAACSERGCDRTDAAYCGYVDSRGRGCKTAWCSDHQVVLGQTAYCRRHGNTLKAIHGSSISSADGSKRGLPGPRIPDYWITGERPDINNRAPSLVEWMRVRLDDGVRNVVARSGQGSVTRKTPVHLVRQPDGVRAWVSEWWVDEGEPHAFPISIRIDEQHQSQVMLCVAGQVVATSVPPWVRRHEERHPTDRLTSEREAQDYYDAQLTAVEDALRTNRRTEASVTQ